MRLGKQPLEAWLLFGGPVKRFHEQSPLLLFQYEPGLRRKRFLGPLTSGADDEIGYVETLPFSGHFD